MSPLLRRISAGLGANAFQQLANIGMQLAALPLFLAVWDAATYGTWLLISAVPAYLFMADVGMVTAAGNRMTMAMGRGAVSEARSVFQSAFVFMCSVCGLVALLALPAVAWLPLPGLPPGLGDERLAMMALVLQVIAAMFVGLTETLFRSTGRYAQGTAGATLVHLGGWLGGFLGLVLYKSYFGVALGALLAEASGLLALAALAGGSRRGLPWGVRDANRSEVRAMIKPALSFMAFPLSFALSFQSLTLLVGAMFGPVAVAVFNTSRTLARVAVQGTALFSYALWPEFSRLFGLGGAAAVAGLYRRSFGLGAALAVAISLAVYSIGEHVLRAWTHGAIDYHPELVTVLLVYAAIGGVWHIPRVLLMATNQHIDLAKWALATAALCLPLALVMGRTWQLPGVAGAMLVAELVVASACIYLARLSLAAAGPLALEAAT